MSKIIVNGTFDIVHVGHIHLLNYARSLGDQLLVCIDSDRRVHELKGPGRPVNNEHDRKILLYNLRSVDSVLVFDSNSDLEKICMEYKPDIMVKGSDYRDQPIVAAEYCKKIVFYDRIQPYSTTAIIQHIANR